MNFLSRLIMLVIMSISFAAPAGAAVTVGDPGSQCDVIADDGDKKSDGDKKPDDEEEPECE